MEVDTGVRRRRVPRQVVGWHGKYVLEDDPLAGWERCWVLDISIIGVGVELFGVVPGDLVGRRVLVEVDSPAGTSVSIRVRGDVRNMGPGPTGGVRAGMALSDLSEAESSILDALELMDMTW